MNMLIAALSPFDTTVIVLAVVGGLHAIVFFMKIVRFFVGELRDELHEWRKLFRGG